VPLAGVRVAVLGLTYKPNTSALRRSSALELCRQLHAAGAEVRAFDPAVRELPAEFAGALRLLPTAAGAFDGADALVIATEWPEFAILDPAVVASAMRRAIVLDPNGFVARAFGPAKDVEYLRVGKAG
jgi:UDPglucose 6-dehydrogenase